MLATAFHPSASSQLAVRSPTRQRSQVAAAVRIRASWQDAAHPLALGTTFFAATFAAAVSSGKRRSRVGRWQSVRLQATGHGGVWPTRRIFASRTLSMADIQVIGYDLDYTLVHYRVEAWEGAVYTEAQQILRRKGFDVEDLAFDPELIIRGLVIDQLLGNIVKVDRYGYVRKALHGMRMLSAEEVQAVYGKQRCRVDLREPRWSFLNTLFSVASGCFFAQLVERTDASSLGDVASPLTSDYRELSRIVESAVSEAHVEGTLKKQILANPEKYVELDSEAALVLLDQKLAGKRLVLITNNDWDYTRKMMSYAYDRYLPNGLTWQNLFDLVITNAQKPDFWCLNSPAWKIVDQERGLAATTPMQKLEVGGIYCGGNARMVERCFGFAGEEVMYIGDHLYADTNVAKSILQWRTCLIMRELEGEVRALALSQGRRRDLGEQLVRRDNLLQMKHRATMQTARARLGLTQWPARNTMERPEVPGDGMAEMMALKCDGMTGSSILKCSAGGDPSAWDKLISEVDKNIQHLDGDLGMPGISARWGFMTRVGINDKSHLFRQVEKYADIYTSRVSNFLPLTPFARFRPPLQSDRVFLDTVTEKGFSDFMCSAVEALGPTEEAWALQPSKLAVIDWGSTPEDDASIAQSLQAISKEGHAQPELNKEEARFRRNQPT